jgi:hypothetical protein
MLKNNSVRSLPTLDPRINLLSSHWYGSKIYRQLGEGEDLGGTVVPDNSDDDEQLQAPGVKALNEWKRRAKELEKQNNLLQKKYSGIDPEEIERIRQANEAREQDELEKQKQYQAALKLKEDKYNQDVEAVRNENLQLQQRLENKLIEQSVVDAFLKSGGKRGDIDRGGSPKEYVNLLLPAIRNQLKVDGDDVIVVDKNGEQRFHPSTFKPYELEDLMADCRNSGATALLFDPADKASGAGAHPNARRASADKMAELNALPPAARIAKAREMGLA